MLEHEELTRQKQFRLQLLHEQFTCKIMQSVELRLLKQNNKIALSRNAGVGALIESIEIVVSKLYVIEENTRKQGKVKHKPQIERDPVTDIIFIKIISNPKPKNAYHICWARFKVATSVLFFTGLRVNQVAFMTQEMVQDFFIDGACNFYQSKVNTQTTILLPPAQKALLNYESIQKYVNIVYKNHDILYLTAIKFPYM